MSAPGHKTINYFSNNLGIINMLTVKLKTLQLIAPIYYDNVINHINSLRSIRDFTKQYSMVNRQIEAFMSASGFSSADLSGYDPSILQYDDFRMILIIYVCVGIISGNEKLSMEDFRGYMSSFREVMGSEFNHNDAVQYFSKHIDIDPSLIPSSVKVDIAKGVEERDANKICESNINLIRLPEPGESFDSYKSFIEGHTSKLVSNLNDAGYMHSYPIDLFTSIILLKKLNFQISSLYRIDGITPLPAGAINAIAKQIFELRQQGITGGSIIGDGIGPIGND